MKLDEMRKAWPKLDRDKRLRALMRISIERSRKVLVQCERWLDKEKDVVVRGRLVRIVASHIADRGTRKQAEVAIHAYVKNQLKARRRRETKEFTGLHGKLRKEIPPDDVMTAGANWTDPYDVNRTPHAGMPVILRPFLVTQNSSAGCMCAADSARSGAGGFRPCPTASGSRPGAP